MNAPSGAMPFAIWLLPDEREAAWLAQRMQALATAHGGPLFEPHVTLHVGQCDSRLDIACALAGAAKAESVSRLDLIAGPTGESQAYFKTLFIAFAPPNADGEALAGLRRRIVARLLDADASAPRDERSLSSSRTAAIDTALAGYRLEPHLSLLYATLPRQARRTLARDNDLRGRSIGFTRLAAVRPAPGHDTLATVDSWQVFGHCPLGASAPR